jgi:hypothetical protein
MAEKVTETHFNADQTVGEFIAELRNFAADNEQFSIKLGKDLILKCTPMKVEQEPEKEESKLMEWLK